MASRFPRQIARVLLALLALVWSGGAEVAAASGIDARARAWVAEVVSRIGTADRAARAAAGRGGRVTIRVRIGADGRLDDLAVEEGPAALGERARRAAQAAGPFAPPPPGLLTLEGYTELSFPLTLR
ncbi:TonB family protein [Methylobacterium sp. Leaf118]|uniref:TonB family protein n=1 Tax=Methylobacterium sp. Leaf118 TaxID=2876562 RepID=UPI001E5B729B|nr:TonB family protein [Methylobacterium sp. Leaf118]